MTVYYNDIDSYCCKVLRKNIQLGHLPKGDVDERDIRTVRANELVGYQHIHLFAGIGGFVLGFQWAGFPERIRVITGGFPCQDISNAGKRAGIEGERSGLWTDMYRLICDIRPDYVCVENVAALLNRGLSRVLGDLASCGYDAEWEVLSAAAFGAPHMRQRMFIVAYPCSKRCEKIFQQYPIFQKTSKSRATGSRGSSFSWRSNCKRPLWAPEPNVVRVADGLPSRVDRLRGLGNAIVPQITQYIAECIMAREAAINSLTA